MTKSSWRRRAAPALLLFLLAPLFGEFLLGNLKFTELYFLPFLALLYGAGALLIREVTRRAGRSYATMLGLGVAYTLIEEGLVDQLFFNPDYFPGQEQLSNTVIPALGLDAWLTLILIGMHTIWSICIPIIIVETIFRERGKGPWLGKAGLGITVAIFLLGSVWIGYETYLESHFWASASQLIGTAVVIAAIIMATFMFKRRAMKPRQGFVPNPWVAGGVALVASSLYMLTEYLPGWTKVGACFLIAAIFFALIYQWSRQQGWSALHTLALAGGGILTYAWLGAVMTPESGPRTTIDNIGTVIFIAGAVWLFTIAFKKLQSSGKTSAITRTGR